MTPKQKVKLNALIQKLVAAEVKSSWSGTLMDDEEREEVAKSAESAQKRLREYIETLVNKTE